MCSLTCISSSSAGNCFILKCDNEILMLDAGVSEKELFKSLNYKNMNMVRGCLVTHL